MKRVFKYISEITLAFVLIFVSYFAWDRIDVEAYETFISQYTLEDVAIILDDDFAQLNYISDETIEPSVLSINNYQNKKYSVNILLELNKVNESLVNNLVLLVDDHTYELDEICVLRIADRYYFLITKINLKEYEKKNYNLKLLIKDDYEFYENYKFSYNIIEEII